MRTRLSHQIPRAPRRENNLGARTMNLSDCLPFLTTCKLVHREATAVLYGNHVFRFDDHPHNSDEHKIPGFNTVVPCCDYLTMYFFLASIGKSNREKLRHIHLDFSTAKFVRYPDEFFDEFFVHGIARYGAGANFIGDAVELLAASHNLQTVSVSFGAGPDSMNYQWILSRAIMGFFYFSPKLAGKISTIRGIAQFKSSIVYEVCKGITASLGEVFLDVANEKIKEMKAKMEVGYPRR